MCMHAYVTCANKVNKCLCVQNIYACIHMYRSKESNKSKNKQYSGPQKVIVSMLDMLKFDIFRWALSTIDKHVTDKKLIPDINQQETQTRR